MKQVSIQIPFDDEKLEALKIFLSQKDQTAEAVIGELIDGLYRKTVPLKVREYIDRRSPRRHWKAEEYNEAEARRFRRLCGFR